MDLESDDLESIDLELTVNQDDRIFWLFSNVLENEFKSGNKSFFNGIISEGKISSFQPPYWSVIYFYNGTIKYGNSFIEETECFHKFIIEIDLIYLEELVFKNKGETSGHNIY